MAAVTDGWDSAQPVRANQSPSAQPVRAPPPSRTTRPLRAKEQKAAAVEAERADKVRKQAKVKAKRETNKARKARTSTR